MISLIMQFALFLTLLFVVVPAVLAFLVVKGDALQHRKPMEWYKARLQG